MPKVSAKLSQVSLRRLPLRAFESVRSERFYTAAVSLDDSCEGAASECCISCDNRPGLQFYSTGTFKYLPI